MYIYLPYVAGKYEILNNLYKSPAVGFKHTRHSTLAVAVGASKSAADHVHSVLLDLKVGKLVFDVTCA